MDSLYMDTATYRVEADARDDQAQDGADWMDWDVLCDAYDMPLPEWEIWRDED